MTASLHIFAKLPTVSRMSKVDYRNKVLMNLLRFKNTNTNNHTNTNTTTITTTTTNNNNRSQCQVDSCTILCVFDSFLYVYIFCLWI